MVSDKIFHPSETRIDINNIKTLEYNALWDTGATNSVITQKIAEDLNLKPIGMTKVHTASHKDVVTEVYMISILLPNKICIPTLRVTKGQVTGHDMLIGMDIINKGDFAVTHNGGKTSFSFRIPSICEIDFTRKNTETDPPAHSTKISRNSSCPCGSGKKYKKCCGSNK